MCSNDPQTGSSTSEAISNGHWVDSTNTLRRPDNSTVITSKGPLEDDKGTLRPSSEVRN